MSKFQKKDVVLFVSEFDSCGWWLGNREEFVSASTALGEEFTENIYIPSKDGVTGKYDVTSGKWLEVNDNSGVKFWDLIGNEYVTVKPDDVVPDDAVLVAPPEYDEKLQYPLFKDGSWQIESFDLEDDEPVKAVEEVEQEEYEPTKIELAYQYLAMTDHFVLKFIEDNRRTIPADIKANRKKCRALLDAHIPSADFLTE